MSDFDFSQNQEIGQLCTQDREWLFNTVREIKPRLSVETGTWKGGGSTFFIASALSLNGFGKLITMESNLELHKEAVHNYIISWPELLPFVEFYAGESLKIIPSLSYLNTIDFAFLDSLCDADNTLSEFNLISDRLNPKGVIMFHDWSTEKARLVKPLLIDNNGWDLTVAEGRYFGDVGMAKASRLWKRQRAENA